MMIMDHNRSRYLHRQSTILFLQLISIFFLCLVTGSNGASSVGSRKTGKSSSVFSLFNLKEKSKFWSESVLHSDVEDLETTSPGKASLQNYTKAGSVAGYMKLLEVDSLYLPVPVNFIFIGFEGKGNHDFKLGPDELERWFTKIDHIFEHTRIPPIGDSLSPFYKIAVDKSRRHHQLPVVSHVNYNFSVHAIQMGEKVTSVFEHAIKSLSRKDNISDTSDDENVLWQVDMETMDLIYTSLVEYLQLEDAYNVFILNPKRNIRAKYGYRRGLSVSEIDFLKENIPLQKKILQSGSKQGSVLALDKIKRPLYEKHPMLKFAWTTTEDIDTVEWSDICVEALENYDKLHHGNETADIIQRQVLQVWAFIDLSAGPFTWGPSVGGEGVRTVHSLPNVTKTIGAVAEMTEEEAENHLQGAIQDKFAVLGDKDHHAIDILLAEIDIYEAFAFKHCKGRKVKLALCEELDERMGDLKDELQTFEDGKYDDSHKAKALDALKRMESWNLFSDTFEESQNYTVARDTFLSDLGATLWGSMRHIISPSIADGSYHHYEKISFQLFFITQEKVRHMKNLPVDLKALMDGLSSLLLPSQKAMFSPHMLPLSEDPALAMAFSVARRAAAVPLLLVNGTYRTSVRSYLDTSILQHQLQRINDHGSLKGQHAQSRSTLEVPIFWFIHNDPLLVDKHYQAKALSDMVIVVQSEQTSWESHLQCNGRSVLWDLRRPLKAALASTAEHLAGLLPLHLVYSQAHETALEDWIWSVGCSPLSITSPGWHVSQFQTDTIARSYVITTLEESIQLVNSAIHLLVMERTCILALGQIINSMCNKYISLKGNLTKTSAEKTFKLFQSQERELVNHYNSISTVTGELRYADALRLLSPLEEKSKGFADFVNTTIASFHPIHCTRGREVKVEFDMTTIPAFLIVLGILWFVLKPRRPKPKIN
ncbi:hypothetical protein C5167_015681 [Papaver somniferum]|uniref:Transmembrane protein n=1 Tax=Papaver somniferum TaxID=3469 RepID=A0A4Y7J6R1_PAPSO|nr:hypothetical protein C5167_015681 [Papaver somniferum]